MGLEQCFSKAPKTEKFSSRTTPSKVLKNNKQIKLVNYQHAKEQETKSKKTASHQDCINNMLKENLFSKWRKLLGVQFA